MRVWGKRGMPIFVMAAALTGATILGYLFNTAHFPETNIVLLYIAAVLLTARYTNGYLWGIGASAASIFSFNYFFTEPYFTFAVNDPSYIITFGVMLLVAVFTSALTTKDKLHARQAEEREEEVKLLYRLTNRLSDADSLEQIGEIAVENISNFFNCQAACIYDMKEEKISQSFLQKCGDRVIHKEVMDVEKLFIKIRDCQK